MSSQQLFPGVALITGAAAGIGRGIACAFAREQCQRIVIADRTEEALQETKKIIEEISSGVKVLACTVDVSSPEDIQGLLDETVALFGRVDYAVNAAGVLGANYRGCWLSSREELKHMVKQEPLPSHDGRPGNRGAIVNIASQLGIVGRPTAPAYCSAKAAVIHMTKSDAIDYSKDNIRINCVCPGLIGTAMVLDNIDYFRPAIGIAPMNRYGTVEEVADCVLFLCSSKATFVQGAALVVDGGYTIN